MRSLTPSGPSSARPFGLELLTTAVLSGSFFSPSITACLALTAVSLYFLPLSGSILRSLAALAAFLLAISHLLELTTPASWWHIGDNLDAYNRFLDARNARAAAGKAPTVSVDHFHRAVQVEHKAWVVIEGWVHSLDGFVHPGGAAILKHLVGSDATGWFVGTHAKHTRALAILASHAIGPLEAPDALLAGPDRAWLQLWQRCRAEKLFAYSWLWLVRELVLEPLSLILFGLHLYLDAGHAVLGMLTITLGANRYGFFAHDAAHMSVFPSVALGRWAGRWMMGLLWGVDLHTGIGIDHTFHHAFPNVLGADHALDTDPLVAWHPKQHSVTKGWGQVAMWFGIAIWCVYPFYVVVGLRQMWRERQFVLLVLIVARLGAWTLLGRFSVPLVASAVLGMAYAGTVAALNHFAKPLRTLDDLAARPRPLSFVQSQTESTQDTTVGEIANWMLGDFTHHAAHHLFPVMPRRNLARIDDDVSAIIELSARQFGHAHDSVDPLEAGRRFVCKLLSRSQTTADVS